MASKVDRPVVLVVLDGWGYRESTEGNAIALARTPTWDRLWARAPRTLLGASGLAVGLPEGQMGTSEVGHLNLGAGRVVMQDLVRIGEAIRSGSFHSNPAFRTACAHARATGGTLHLVGLVGDGGVHGHDDHLVALVDLAERERVPHVALHFLLDGRDTLPMSALGFVRAVMARIGRRATIASIGGRYFGMDRDQRWSRTQKWYDAAVRGVGPSTDDALRFIEENYARGVTDEFQEPAVVLHDGRPVAPMRDGDAVITWNFRSDRMRQIVRSIAIAGFDGFDVRDRPKLHVATMTQYDQTYGLPIAFEPFSMAKIMAEVLQDNGMSSLRTAETEKYPHVTYFFNGGNEVPYTGEERILVPSQKVATYDLMPEMSAAAGAGDRGAHARVHAVQLREWRHGRAQRQHRGDDQGVRMRGRTAGEGGGGGGARGRATPDHGRPRQLRDDDRPRDRWAAHGPHDQSRAAPAGRGWRGDPAARRWRAL
jgi:2,3-bisphosphoglycerate-independent phosphoglycerate mutase